MLHGKRIILRLIRNEDECRNLLEAHNNLTQRSDTDHTEIKHPQVLIQQFEVSKISED